jgi:DNA-binding MurR/RpiR family transcriptional regulator
MSSKDLGKACFVSTATVYRLCDELNLAGFSDLKIKITSSLNDYLKSNGDFNFDFPVNPYEIVHKIKEDYEQTLNLTANLFSLDQLRLIASAMKKAKVIDIYTSAGNINFALNFQFQMKEIGIDVNVPIDEYHQRLTAASSNQEHLAIVITFGGRGILSDILPRILTKTKTPSF